MPPAYRPSTERSLRTENLTVREFINLISIEPKLHRRDVPVDVPALANE